MLPVVVTAPAFLERALLTFQLLGLARLSNSSHLKEFQFVAGHSVRGMLHRGNVD